MTPVATPEDGPQAAWVRLWQRRLAGLQPTPAAVERLDPGLLWGVAVPMLVQLEQRLALGDADLRGWRGGTSARRRPLLALNAPVGAGKTTLGAALAALAPLAGIRLAVASIDDLYLPWSERRRAMAGNPFGVGRVPPGSHDLPLLLEALQQWREGGTLRLPRFDKALRQGQGDRCGWLEHGADALLLEGWLLGCRALGDGPLAEQLAALERDGGPGLAMPLALAERRWLPRWNRNLVAYQPLWEACDGLWLLRPTHWRLPLRWRLQAEAHQRRKGGGWLAPAAVRQLVRASLCSLPPELYQQPLELDAQPASGVKGGSEGAATHGQPDAREWGENGPLPLLGLAELDGRRRCRLSWTQLSASSASSATG